MVVLMAAIVLAAEVSANPVRSAPTRPGATTPPKVESKGTAQKIEPKTVPVQKAEPPFCVTNEMRATARPVSASAASPAARQMKFTEHDAAALAASSALGSAKLTKRWETASSATSGSGVPWGTKASTVAVSPSRTGLQYPAPAASASPPESGPYTRASALPRKRSSALLGSSLAAAASSLSSSACSGDQARWSQCSQKVLTIRRRLAPAGSAGVSTTIALVLPAGKPIFGISTCQPSAVSTSSRGGSHG